MLISYGILIILAMLAGLWSRNNALGYWGGFFMELFLTVLFSPVLGQTSIVLGVIVVFILNRVASDDPRKRICPFSKDVYCECVTYFDEESSRRAGKCKNGLSK